MTTDINDLLRSQGFEADGLPYPFIEWHFSASEGPCRLVLLALAHSGLQNEKESIAVLRAIAFQHPQMIEEFPNMPWPGGLP